jgi:maltose alpha-D-glucosyltransferase/alpha-amylase
MVTATRPRRTRRVASEPPLLDDDPLWYKNAVIYQTHVRAFSDSNADGVGDFPGLTSKLDYLQDLGVTAIWIMPFYPSPLRDDGYDIADYNDVNPIYGDLGDVKEFVREAHRRGMRVITELVCNHTSDQHEWFQKSRRAKPGSVWRDFYVWSDTPEKYREARIIFRDFEPSNWSWDPVARAYYWHRFYSHQPDLNFDNPRVHEAIFRAMEFWLDMGVDGLRLDAIPYLYEREGTICENLPETHQFLKKLRARIDAKYKNRMLLAEANQWPEDAAAYFGDGDECHMNFHFPLMPRLFMSIRMEDRYPLVDILNQTPEIPANAQWATFLRNHDELTLEMVTDEERDYMWRVYATDPRARINMGIRRRLAPLMDNNRRRIELMNGLLFSLPGSPIIYYGDEIGMGDNIYLGDRNGVRTPMQWSGDRNAGFSHANPQRLYFPVITDPEYHYQTVNVEAQQNNPQSLLWWMKRLIALRKRNPAFASGSVEFLHPENRKVLAFLRRTEEQTLLVVANLSRFVQAAELDLSMLQGKIPVELFGHNDFPAIGELPYFITLGPHSFYWFSIEQPRVALPSLDGATGPRIATVSAGPRWEGLSAERNRTALLDALPEFLPSRRWFGGKARRITTTQIVDVLPMSYVGRQAEIAFVQVNYSEGDPETYILPLTYQPIEDEAPLDERLATAAVARIRTREGTGLLYDATADPEFSETLLNAVERRRRFRGPHGTITATPSRAFRELRGESDEQLRVSQVRGEQTNTSIIFGERLILKLFRRLENGTNPDLEIGRYLTEEARFPNTAPVAGFLEYRRTGQEGEPATLGILQGFIRNEGDAWQHTLDELGRFVERAMASAEEPDDVNVSVGRLLQRVDEETPELAHELMDAFLSQVRLLGRRTAEMHLALARNVSNPRFAPEPVNPLYQRSVYQSMRSQLNQIFQLFRRAQKSLPEQIQADGQKLLNLEPDIQERLRVLLERKFTTQRTRLHGDYHLGQVLFTGSDFVIIDFEGEPARPLNERRTKRSPLRDVAGMLRSFHYAAYSAMFEELETGVAGAASRDRLERWVRYWYKWVSVAFLSGYLSSAGEASFLPKDRDELRVLLELFLLHKAIYELGYELNNRPTWVQIPMAGILDIVGSSEG